MSFVTLPVIEAMKIYFLVRMKTEYDQKMSQSQQKDPTVSTANMSSV